MVHITPSTKTLAVACTTQCRQHHCCFANALMRSMATETTAVTGVQQLLHWYGGDGGAHNTLQGPSTRVAWLSHYTWHCPPASGQPLCPIGKSRHARQSKKLCAYLPGFVDFHTHMLPVIKASTLQPAAIDKPGTVGSCAIAEGNTTRNQHQRNG
jgi:hypothetical protein